jgi:hypothetical protein
MVVVNGGGYQFLPPGKGQISRVFAGNFASQKVR